MVILLQLILIINNINIWAKKRLARGRNFSLHMIQLNLYDRDYSGADPDPTLITTKSGSGFDFLINNNSDEKSVITFMSL